MRRSTNITLALMLAATLTPASGAKDDLDNGTPFGEPSDKAVARLFALAQTHGEDWRLAGTERLLKRSISSCLTNK